MHPQSFRAGLAGLAIFALAPVASQAAPVTLNLQGHVTGYEFIDLSDDLPVDTAVSVSLTFNETFSDGSYSFADNLGPVSGSMTVGNAGYSFDGFWPITYHLAPDGSSLEWVTPVFTGTGPDLGTGDFFGLWASFTPALTLAGELALGFRFELDFHGIRPRHRRQLQHHACQHGAHPGHAGAGGDGAAGGGRVAAPGLSRPLVCEASERLRPGQLGQHPPQFCAQAGQVRNRASGVNP